MSTLHRAVVRAYSGATHKADVQLLQSVPTYLTAIPVATNIPPAYVVAGRECAVLLFDDNPDNGVVVTVHGAVPGSLGDTIIDDELAVGPGATIQPGVYTWIGLVGTGVNGKIGLAVDLGSGPTAPGATSVVGISGRAVARDSATVLAIGLDYIAGASAVSPATAIGVRSSVIGPGSAQTITDFVAFEAKMGTTFGGTITNHYGFRIPQMTIGTNRRPFWESGRTGTPTDADGNRFRSNTQFGSTTGAFGGGDGVIGIANATTNPSTNPAGGGILYASGGALVWRGSAGTVTTIAPA